MSRKQATSEDGFMTPEFKEALTGALQQQNAAATERMDEFNRKADERVQLMLQAMSQNATLFQNALLANQQQQIDLTSAISQIPSLSGAGGGGQAKHQPPTREPPKLDTTIRTVANFELYRAEIAAHGGPTYIEAHKHDDSGAAPTAQRTSSNTALFGYILAGVADAEYKRLIIDAQNMADYPHNTASAALSALEKALLGDKEERDSRLIKSWDALLLGSERFVIFATNLKAIRTALRVAGRDEQDGRGNVHQARISAQESSTTPQAASGLASLDEASLRPAQDGGRGPQTSAGAG